MATIEKSFPKQFLTIDNEPQSLLQSTQKRINKLNGIKPPIIICNEEHRFLVAEQMREINIKPNIILLEPFGRNTAPAVTLAAIKALQIEKDPTLLILSSDHIIKNESQFIKIVESGLKYVDEDRLITFGVIPNSPETGYGYIKSREPLIENSIKGSIIESFIEKPNLEKAKEFIEDKRYSWNSGMFLFNAELILNEIKEFSPEILTCCEASLKDDLYDLYFQRLNKCAFSKCPNISIDVEIIENTKKGTVLPLSGGWTDIGSWDAVWKISNKDENGNFTQGNVIQKNTKNCYLRSEKRLLTALGVQDLIVIETSDAILVANMNCSQEVKSVVEFLKDKKIPAGKNHKKIYRPWGFYESIVEVIDGKLN